MQNAYDYDLHFCVQELLVAFISSLVLTFFQHFVCLDFFIIFCYFSRYILGFCS